MIFGSIAMAALAPQAEEMRLMRYPDIYGETVVFTWGGDLWTAERTGGYARRLTSHPGEELRANFSPDGRWIAFSGQYDSNSFDVYVIPAEGGEPKRLTYVAGSDYVLDWKDNENVAYVSQWQTTDGPTYGLFTIDKDGGMANKSEVEEIREGSYSPTGNRIAYQRKSAVQLDWRRYRGGMQGRISIWDFDANEYYEIPVEHEQNHWPLWVGDDIYYSSDKDQLTLNLYRYDTDTRRIEQLTEFDDHDVRWPETDGNTIVFERDGYLWFYAIDSGEIERFGPRVIGDLLDRRASYRRVGSEISDFDISPSAKRLVVQARGEIFSVPAENGPTRNMSDTSGAREQSPRWSPDGNTIAYISDESGEVQIYTEPQMGGEATMLDTPLEHKIQSIAWSPDSKMISYTTADGTLCYIVLSSGAITEVVTDRYGAQPRYDWSPDSRWIGYTTAQPNLFNAAYLYNLEADESHQITSGFYSDDIISFDLNGKYLYLVSARTFIPQPSSFELNLNLAPPQRVYVLTLDKDEPSPLLPESDEEPGTPPPAEEKKEETPPQQTPPQEAPAEEPQEEEEDGITIDLEGLADRMIPLPWGPSVYPFIVGANNGVFAFEGGTLRKFDFGPKQSQDIISGISGAAFTPDRSHIAYMVGPILGISPVRPGINPGAGAVNTADVAFRVDPVAEWQQMLWELHRYMRDHFYDPDMLGLDWRALVAHYEAMLPYVADRSDLTAMMWKLVGELGTGHAYVSGPPPDLPTTAPVGMLGADYDISGEYVQFEKIYPGNTFEPGRAGPLGAPGVTIKEGDYLIAINGEELDPRTGNLHSLLIGTPGDRVVLTVNDTPSSVGAREEIVIPIASEGDLRYISWVEDNRRKVSEMSDGRIGYIHVPNTSIQGVAELLKGYYSQSDKEAWVIDERYNGGGWIPTAKIELLMREYMTAIRPRYGEDIKFPPQTLDGPKAMLINAYAGSGGDLFPWFFREYEIGPLIGERTWGGLVGISGAHQFVDGGTVTAPAFGLYDFETGDWIAENMGVTPDIPVDNNPETMLGGHDPQLEVAVQWLLDALEDRDEAPYKRPDFPVVIPPRRGG